MTNFSHLHRRAFLSRTAMGVGTAALGSLLSGNVTKVLISAAIWLPYLILSERVNLTYRLRLPSDKQA